MVRTEVRLGDRRPERRVLGDLKEDDGTVIRDGAEQEERALEARNPPCAEVDRPDHPPSDELV